MVLSSQNRELRQRRRDFEAVARGNQRDLIRPVGAPSPTSLEKGQVAVQSLLHAFVEKVPQRGG